MAKKKKAKKEKIAKKKTAKKGKKAKKKKTKLIKCLGIKKNGEECEQMFNSTGPAHRLCPKCIQRNTQVRSSKGAQVKSNGLVNRKSPSL